MTDADDFFTRATALIDRLERLLPPEAATFDAKTANTFRQDQYLFIVDYWLAKCRRRSWIPL